MRPTPAGITRSSWRRLPIMAMLVVGVVVASFAPAAALSEADAGCRAAIGARLGRYAGILLNETHDCHALRMRGLLPESLACDDQSAWEGAGFQSGAFRVRRAYDRMLSEVNTRCAGASSPADLGFATCPAPCAAAVTSYTDLGSCLACLADAAVAGLVRGTHGVPPLVSAAGKVALSCQTRIGRAAEVLLKARLFFARTCQTRKDNGRPEVASVDCRAVEDPQHPFGKTFGRIASTAEQNIARCQSRDGVDIGATLDSCGIDVPTEQACVKTAAAATANSLFAYVYEPPGTPTPTPTLTPTPTPVFTFTPTCAPTGTPPPFPNCGVGEVVACVPPFGMCAGICEPCTYARPGCPSVTCTDCRCCHCGTPTPSPTRTQTAQPECAGSPCPDLHPTGVSLAPGPGCIASIFDFHPEAIVCVANGGDGDAGAFHVSYGAAGGPGIIEYAVAGLAAQSVDCRNAGAYAYGFTHRVIADVGNEVNESNELNNVYDFPVAQPSYPPTCTYGASPTVTHTPTPTTTGLSTPTRTPTSCGAEAPTINPVDSPTTLLEQVIVGVGRVTGARVMAFSSPAGCTQPTPVMFGGTYSALCQLLPNQDNRIDVCIHNQLCGGSACSSASIVHADPTLTPTPPPYTPTPTPT